MCVRSWRRRWEIWNGAEHGVRMTFVAELILTPRLKRGHAGFQLLNLFIAASMPSARMNSTASAAWKINSSAMGCSEGRNGEST
jgi:hypothetical protein